MVEAEIVQVQLKRKPGTEDIPLPAYLSERRAAWTYGRVDAPVRFSPGRG